jgi:hypothetical protein
MQYFAELWKLPAPGKRDRLHPVPIPNTIHPTRSIAVQIVGGHRLEGNRMVSSSIDRRSERYGFESVDSMTAFFSKWIPETEIRDLVDQSVTAFRMRKDSSPAETHLQKIQKAEFAIVRRLVHRNPVLL